MHGDEVSEQHRGEGPSLGTGPSLGGKPSLANGGGSEEVSSPESEAGDSFTVEAALGEGRDISSPESSGGEEVTRRTQRVGVGQGEESRAGSERQTGV